MKKVTILTIILVALIGQTGFGQMPEEFLSRINYYEKKEVNYSLPTEGDVNCLTLRELAEYHGYRQLYSVEELIDTDGELLTENVYLEEYKVRDEWMPGIDRVFIGKDLMSVSYKDESIYEIPRYDSGVTHDHMDFSEVLYYGIDYLDEQYYDNYIQYLNAIAMTVTENNGIITGSNEFYSMFYDHNIKISGETNYDSLGQKTSELVIEYDYDQEQGFYYPEKEILIEWFLTDNGCCVKKTTIITRYKYQRTLGTSFTPGERLEPKKSDKKIELEQKKFEIKPEENNTAFRVTHLKNKTIELNVIVYDMAGREVLSKKAYSGERINLPLGLRAGMYVVHAFQDNNPTPIVGKLIKTDSSYNF